MNGAARKPDRILTIIVAAIAGLVILALAVVFTRGVPPAPDESTPVGVVQRYSAAVLGGNTAVADSYLHGGSPGLVPRRGLSRPAARQGCPDLDDGDGQLCACAGFSRHFRFRRPPRTLRV